MSPDEWRYAIILISSVIFGQILRLTNGATRKKILSSSVGLTMVVSTCGWKSTHSLITAVVNSFIVKYLPNRYCHIASFIWCFSYLAFFRMTEIFGLPKMSGVVNAVQLLLTLRMVGLAFEVNESREYKKKLKKEEGNEELKLTVEYRDVDPSIPDMIMYGYCYIGLFTGPYFRYRTYHDMLHLKNSPKIDVVPALLAKIKVLPLSFAIFLLTAHYFDLEFASTEEFQERPFWYRLFYMVMVWLWFRTRMYCAWILAELVCVSSLLGAYPAVSLPRCGQGPTDLKALKALSDKDTEDIDYSFETIRNIDIHGCELAPGVRGGMKAWNKSVQYWLAAFVYRKFPMKSIRTTVTMAVSAYWHGLHPGYYLSFLSMPLFTMAQDDVTKAFRNDASPFQQKVVDTFLWFLWIRQVEYVSVAFLMLRFDWTIAYWSSIYYCMHVFTIFVIIVAKVFLVIKKPSANVEPAGKKDN
ncbi:lysophospholipid acyltransferase 7-like [Lineus longissimus]|uniref:lysophospholipid acyltransferase 7-like n=1 Tax=Lineus longissimus TaxID=88925 RepID=UPI002B4F7990